MYVCDGDSTTTTTIASYSNHNNSSNSISVCANLVLSKEVLGWCIARVVTARYRVV